MSRKRDQLDREALERAVENMPARFRTKDISERADVRAANPALASDPRFNQLVGSWLAENQAHLGLRQETFGMSDARWVRIGMG